MLNAKLIVVGGEAKAGEFQLRLPCQIGRGKQATLTLPHHLVSRKHCEISERDGQLVVRDLGSMNGTYINNHKIEAESILEPGQLLTIGTVTFRAFYEVGDDISAVSPEFPESQDTPAIVETESAGRVRETVPTESVGEHADLSDRETVYDEENRASDTDKSLPAIMTGSPSSGSEVDFTEIEGSDVNSEEMVGLSALDSLPDAPANVSFKQVHADNPVRAIESAVNLDIDTSNPEQAGSELNSFLKKLPR